MRSVEAEQHSVAATDGTRPRTVLVGVMVCTMALAGSLLLVHLRGSFTIDGSAATAAGRGVKVPLDLTFRNTNGFPISVTNVTVTVRHVNAPDADQSHGCTKHDFAVEQLSDDVSVTVGAHATRSLSELQVPNASWPDVSLIGQSVDDGCMGASLTFDYTASRSLKLW